MESVLITGGAGYIGSHVAKLFLSKGEKVVIFDNLSKGHGQVPEILKKYGDLEFIQGDLLDRSLLEKVFSSHKFKAFLHFAALCSVDESVSKPSLYFNNNVMGSLNLIETAKNANVTKFVFSSTCATYGETKYLPVDENHPQEPVNPYGESKFMVERIINWYSKSYDMKAVILRYFNVCGADEEGVIGDGKKPSVHLMQNAVRGALGLEPFKLTCGKVDTPDATPIRDYVNVLDLADGHYLAYKYLLNGGETAAFNLGTGSGNSVLEIVKKVSEVIGVNIEATIGEARKGEYAKIYASYDKAKRLLGWRPQRTLEDSVKSLVLWYKTHPNGYEY